jgi:DNA-directed RNA polymerase specialized sigma24 family protein
MLTQDVADPETWLERFEVATWLDHMRQHHRATVADRTAEDAVLALHRGETPPRVRHFLERPLAAFGTERTRPANAQAPDTAVKSE